MGSLNIPSEKLGIVLDAVAEAVRTVEVLFGPKQGAAKRHAAIKFVRQVVPALDNNMVPDWLEDVTIGILVDAIVRTLNRNGGIQTNRNGSIQS